MISKHQRIVFWVLVASILAMGGWLFHVHQRERDRLQELGTNDVLDAPSGGDTEPITLDMANDSDGSITATTQPLALPQDTNARARALLDRLMAEYARQGSTHPLPATQSGAVDSVYLIPLPVVGHAINPNARPGADGEPSTQPVQPGPDAVQPQTPGGELAVINLRGSFVTAHPSGVEVETLTILSMLGTLHANIPAIEQVKFLVDGQSRDTLAGHADLLKMYPTRDTTTK